MKKTEHRSFDEADEVRDFTHGRAEILNVGGGEIGRLVLQPGWRWSNDVKPIAKTESCEAPHFQYHVSGRIAIRMDDGTEFIAGPGDVTSLPSGHDAWVVGEEPVPGSEGSTVELQLDGASTGITLMANAIYSCTVYRVLLREQKAAAPNDPLSF